MKVTCACAAFNEADHIDACLESLRNQTGDPIDELLVYDGGSDDGTRDLAREYADRVMVNETGGKLTDRNLVVEEWATDADVILWADADREYPADWASKLLRHFDDPGVVAVSGTVRAKGDGLSSLGTELFYDPVIAGGSSALLSGGNFLNGGNSATRRSEFILAGGLKADAVDEHAHLETWVEEELAFADRMADFGRVVYDTEAVTFERDIDRVLERYSPVAIGDHAEEIADGKRM